MLRSRVANLSKSFKRDITTNIPALQKASDPIQQLFLDKLREYKSKSVGGKLVDASPDLLKEREAELEKIGAQYGIKKGEDPTKFPSFTFQDPPISL